MFGEFNIGIIFYLLLAYYSRIGAIFVLLALVYRGLIMKESKVY